MLTSFGTKEIRKLRYVCKILRVSRVLIARSTRGTYHYNDAELIWPTSGRSRAVVIMPMHWYNPNINAGSGSWQHLDERNGILNEGQKVDLCYLDHRGWTYMGIFRCLQRGSLSIDQLKGLGPTVSACLSSLSFVSPKHLCRLRTDVIARPFASPILSQDSC